MSSGTHSAGGRRVLRIVSSSRLRTSSAGSDPAQPAYADMSTSDRTMLGWRCAKASARPPPHDKPAT